MALLAALLGLLWLTAQLPGDARGRLPGPADPTGAAWSLYPIPIPQSPCAPGPGWSREAPGGVICLITAARTDRGVSEEKEETEKTQAGLSLSLSALLVCHHIKSVLKQPLQT